MICKRIFEQKPKKRINGNTKNMHNVVAKMIIFLFGLSLFAHYLG